LTENDDSPGKNVRWVSMGASVWFLAEAKPIYWGG